MEDHERKVNFRFEEEGGTQITHFPRDIETSIRNLSTKRKVFYCN